MERHTKKITFDELKTKERKRLTDELDSLIEKARTKKRKRLISIVKTKTDQFFASLSIAQSCVGNNDYFKKNFHGEIRDKLISIKKRGTWKGLRAEGQTLNEFIHLLNSKVKPLNINKFGEFFLQYK